MFFDHALEERAIATAARQLLPVLQNNDIFSAVDRDEFLDLACVHDRGAMNPDEVIWI